MMPEALSRLVAEFRKLPAVGLKTASRYAYSILEMSEADAEDFANAVIEARRKIHICKLCGDYTEGEICQRCQTADKSTILVVGEPKDIRAIEKLGTYNGLYHALHGLLDFRKGVGAENIRIKELLERLNGVKEVILATNPDISGEMTANYLAGLIKPMGIKVTRLAHGIPMGSEIEYADEMTLERALDDRKEL
ncbi:MAG TPA: recombination protein RecR [Candidatus Stercoripulliclostridium merdigallinarum]|uniref:Recombination protein RecR n=1 Tax=Candidatus Stercoripulliclostridium merdigallinarum TaxID=2840951 RepID=A0A9D1MGT9_9FIRM|nr:recombination protein RecR [Candidatus Stercoripulliclostridium merdigallinarum]